MYNVSIKFFCKVKKFFKRVIVNEVVAVNESNIFSPRRINRRISRRTGITAVFRQLRQRQAFIKLRQKIFDDADGIIRTAIVNHNYFNIRQRLI